MNFFKLNEFFPHCSPKEINDVAGSPQMSANLYRLWGLLYLLRMALKAPIVINSGYRDKEHNRRVGGVATSQHLKMEAVDVTCHTSELTEKLAMMIAFDLESNSVGQVIYYKNRNFIHIALPCDKYPTRYFSEK